MQFCEWLDAIQIWIDQCIEYISIILHTEAVKAFICIDFKDE